MYYESSFFWCRMLKITSRNVRVVLPILLQHTSLLKRFSNTALTNLPLCFYVYIDRSRDEISRKYSEYGRAAVENLGYLSIRTDTTR